MNQENYVPIDCGIYSEYEVAILHKQPLQLRWRQDDSEIIEKEVLPQDLRTVRDAGEFLVVRDRTGHEYHVRLDRILQSKNSAS